MSSGNWSAMLANIDTLRIDMEFVPGAETTGLDNVLLVMVPEPSTGLLVLGGILGLTWRSQKYASTVRAAAVTRR